MTRIKIPFANVEVKKIVDDNKPTNAEGLELNVSPVSLSEFFEKVPPNSCLNTINLVFFDGAEKESYNELLDEKKFRFELSFEKEKVNFCVLGEEEKEIDDTKIEIDYLKKDGANDVLRIFFKPQFAGVVKITHRGSEEKDDGGGNQNPPSDNSNDNQQKIIDLQNQINALEEKLRKQPTSNNSSANKQKLERLKSEIEGLKKKRKGKQNEGGNKKNDFPTGLVIGGGIQIITEILRKNNYQPIIFPTFEAQELFTSSLGSTTDIINKEMYNFLDKKGRELALRPEGTASTLGVELVNTRGVIADYQILKLIADILSGLGIKNFTFNLNYLGDYQTKEKYKNELKNLVEKNHPDLCEDCQRRYKNNPLRILDCLLLRGLDYYTGLVFEVDLGTEKAILGGGRYDSLYQEIGNINLPAIGFAVGIERLVDYLEEKKLLKIDHKELAQFSLTMDYNSEVKKMKHLAKIIDYYQPKLLIILGEKELKSGKILIKDCQQRQEFLVEKEKLVK
ncbi:17011_t:CDS:2 [Funneliformis geosporum]|nr:17011_t:CDS:2 [Funneliformis geosporum]